MAVTRDPRFEATFWDEPTSGGTGVYCVKFIDRVGPTYGLDAVKATGEARPAKYGSMTNTNGFPVMRLAEVVLNWVEAKAELAYHHGGAAVTQDDIDRSINAIRLRPLDAEAIAKGVKQTAPLVLAELADDPARTSSIEAATLAGVVATPLLWEIRRERRMEFFLEQTRILDLRRWGKLELMDCDLNPEIMVGAWVDLNNTKKLQKSFDHLTAAQFGKLKVQKLDGTVVTFDGEADSNGNIISSHATEMVGFRIPTSVSKRYSIEQRHYLEPICTDVISQYTTRGYSIEQNPGW